MVRVEPSHPLSRRRRVLINGEANTRKTTTLLTFPRPLAVVSYPGEKGWATLLTADGTPVAPDVLPFIFTEDKAQDSHAVIRDVERVLLEIRAGKHGLVQTIACEGLHKYAEVLMDSVTDGAYFSGLDFERKLWARGYRTVHEHLNTLMETSVPVVVFTCWADVDRDRAQKPGEKDQDVPSHVRPDLFGKLAKQMMGEFSVVLHQSIRKLEAKDEKSQAVWQTRPAGEIAGCGIKGPVEVVEKVPLLLKAEYASLEQYVWKEAEG